MTAAALVHDYYRKLLVALLTQKLIRVACEISPGGNALRATPPQPRGMATLMVQRVASGERRFYVRGGVEPTRLC
jgi:hypothetical protein